MPYLKRALEDRMASALNVHPVLVLTGPRQVGKSTLLQNASFLKGWRYLTLDDPDILEQAKEDPKGLLLDQSPTIIDEVQRHTPLFLTIKYFVDQARRKRRFILSGSGNIPLRGGPRETLAGRARYLHLTPLSFHEMSQRKKEGFLTSFLNGKVQNFSFKSKSTPFLKNIWQGGLPRVVLATSRKTHLDLMAGYVDTYLGRDIQDLVKVRHPERVRQLMIELAKVTGWESRQEDLARLIGEERSNVSRYISLLQETNLIYELRGYVSRRERAYKQAKYYWFDSGLACFLSGLTSPRDIEKGATKGRYFETFVFQQILFTQSLQIVPFQIFYWRLKNQDGEVDFVLKNQNGLIPIEVKSTTELTFRHTQSIRNFLKTHPESQEGIVVYAGSKLFQVASRIWAVPWGAL